MIIKSVKLQFYILGPLIVAGFTVLGALLTYQWMRLYPKISEGDLGPLIAIITLLVIAAFLSGFIIFWAVVRPLEAFMKKSGHLVADSRATTPAKHSLEPAVDFSRMLTRVTEVLDNLEARALFPNIIAPSPAMRGVLGLVLKIAPTDSSVLILGESGTGKELIARNLHAHSRRSQQPFVAINCAGLPEGLLESELFGHEKGAFTGAHARKIGKLELAHHGTLFLDEIADMPLLLQAKILRALEQREIDRVGGSRPIPVDIRILAATNKDLHRMVSEGTFREDLLFRINVFSLRLPPLRERREDIPLLASHLLHQIKPTATFSAEALALLIAHQWPGNVRELKNCVEAAAALSDTVIDPDHLNLGPALSTTIPHEATSLNLDERLNAMERAMILDALIRSEGVQVRAAEFLGIKERSLWHRISKLQIDVSSIKSRKTSANPDNPQNMEEAPPESGGTQTP